MLIAHVRVAIELSEKETLEFIPPSLWPSNSPDLNPVNYTVWGILQEKVFKLRITDLDSGPTETAIENGREWAKLDHVDIATAIRQGRRQ